MKIVIVGAGFAGLRAAHLLTWANADVLVVDRNNYHTFSPLLYQVAAAELEPEEIVHPVRSTFRGKSSFRMLVDEVNSVHLGKKLVVTRKQVIPYDFLILAMGSSTHFYHVTGAAEFALQMKNLEDAMSIRNRILSRFESALNENDPARRIRMLTFTIVGGGPTGVEFSGALAELIRGPLARDYATLDSREIQILLLEGTDHLLPGLPYKLQEYSLHRLQKMGVKVLLKAMVTQITSTSITLKDGTKIPSETVIWTAGVRGAPPVQPVDLPVLPNGQIQVSPTLQVPGYPGVYVAGDLARVEEVGQMVPMVAPMAVQEGEIAARNILHQVMGEKLQAFHYHDPGSLITIGRNAAVVKLGRWNFTGFPAWLLWLGVHLYKLIGFRNRLLVLIDWAWDYLFFERGVRLIVPFLKEQRENSGKLG